MCLASPWTNKNTLDGKVIDQRIKIKSRGIRERNKGIGDFEMKWFVVTIVVIVFAIYVWQTM